MSTGEARFGNDDERFVRFDLHGSEVVPTLVRALEAHAAAPKHWLVSGAAGLGRSYVLQAACHRANVDARWLPLDFSIYEPDLKASPLEQLERLIEHRLDEEREYDEARRKARMALGTSALQWLAKNMTKLEKLPTLPLEMQMLVALGTQSFAIDALQKFFAPDLRPAPPSPDEALVPYLKALAADGLVVLHAEANQLPQDVRYLLVRAAERVSNVVLAMSCTDADTERSLLVGSTQDVVRVQVEALPKDVLKARVANAFSPHDLPDEFFDAVYTASRGVPGAAVRLLLDLVTSGGLDQPDGRWVWPAEGMEASSVASAFDASLERTLKRHLGQLDFEDRGMGLQFLELLALTGPVPSTLLLHYLAPGDEDIQEHIIDWLDDHLAACFDGSEDGDMPLEGGTPILRDWQFTHPNFPDGRFGTIYDFVHPHHAAVLRSWLTPEQRASMAELLLPVLSRTGHLDTGSLAESRVFLQLAEHLPEAERMKWLDHVLWTIQPEYEEKLVDELGARLQDEDPDPEFLWAGYEGLRDRWPPHRILVLLEAYVRHPHRIPESRELKVWDELCFQRIQADRFEEAKAATEELARLAAAQTSTETSWWEPWAEVRHADIELQMGDSAAAETRLKKALPELQARGARNDSIAVVHTLLVSCCIKRGAWAEAKPHAEARVRLLKASLEIEHGEIAWALAELGFLTYQLGEVGGRSNLEEALVFLIEAYGPTHNRVGVQYVHLGRVLATEGDFEAAVDRIEAGLAILAKRLGPLASGVAWGLGELGAVFEAQNRTDEARLRYQAALQILEAVSGSDHPETAYARQRLAALPPMEVTSDESE